MTNIAFAKDVYDTVKTLCPDLRLYWLCKDPRDGQHCIADDILPDFAITTMEYVGLLALTLEDAVKFSRYIRKKGARHFYHFTKWNNFVISGEYHPPLDKYDSHNHWLEYAECVKCAVLTCMIHTHS